MARVQITTRALADLERLFEFIAVHNPKLAPERMLSVRRAFELLSDHPLLGRPAEDGRRELVLSRGRYGYAAKYRWYLMRLGPTTSPIRSVSTFPRSVTCMEEAQCYSTSASQNEIPRAAHWKSMCLI